MGCKCGKKVLEPIYTPVASVQRTSYTYEEAEPEILHASSSEEAVEESKLFLYCFNDPEVPTKLLQYEANSHQLETLDLPLKLYSECGIVCFNNSRVIFAGGYDLFCSSEVKNCFVLECSGGELSEISSLPSARRRLRLIQVEDSVYAVGGVREIQTRTDFAKAIYQDYSESLSKYLPREDKWEQLPDLPKGVEFPAVYSVASKIYVCGGLQIEGNSNHVLDEIQTFDVQKSAWSVLGVKLPVPLFLHQAVFCGEFVVIFGGNDGEENVHKTFMLKDEKIKEMASLPEKHCSSFPYSVLRDGLQIFTFNEDNFLYTLNTSLSCWTVCNLSEIGC